MVTPRSLALVAVCLLPASGCVSATAAGIEVPSAGLGRGWEEGAAGGEVGAAVPEERHSSTTIPGGLACLIRARELDIPHRNHGDLRGVTTPIVLTGAVGGLSLRSMGRRALVCDCRLALALHRAAPLLARLGVTELHFSSSYRWSRMPSGGLSRHAMGLALDVHRLRVGTELLRVEEDFQRGAGDGCDAGAPPLNRVACLLRRAGLFDRVLTPDTDAAHYNHLHLAILPLHRRKFPPPGTPPEPETD